MSLSRPIKLAIADDHILFRKGMISLIEMVGGDYVILFEASNGLDVQRLIRKDDPPDVILMDVNMPRMDGFACVEWLGIHFPEVKVLVVSMIEREETVVKMLKLGVKGYLCKDVEPAELRAALETIVNRGFYYTDFLTGKLVHSLLQEDAVAGEGQLKKINDRERVFLEWACSELTYHEIADKMSLSPKTIDGYRNSLFEKLGVKSRVGLVMYAIRNKLVALE